MKRNAVTIAKFIIVFATFTILFCQIFSITIKFNTSVDMKSGNINPELNVDPYKKIDWHDYKQIVVENRRTGLGEQGSAVFMDPFESAAKEAIFKVNGFNGLASDKMSLNRSVKDIRHPECKNQLYQASLPSVSIIIPFYEEHWSTLLRTFISAINRAPKGLIKEIILVDDCSTKEFLKDKLDQYIHKHYKGIVRVLRQKKREGLIRTRLEGAKNATGDVLIFLDSHCESNVNWLPPLLDPIAQDYRTVTCPFIDVLDHDTFEYRSQDEGARGAFDWEFYYKRLPLLPDDIKNAPKPFKSPVMAGGLFAISRKWFWELGGYDPGLDIWGGEQYELSFKLWQCGGQMLDVPCSRIGHVYRKYAPFPAVINLGNFLARNYKRVAEVWMDDYKQYLYRRQPSWKKESVGDLSAQFAIRKRLKCKSFKWFMTEIAFDLEKHYPAIEPPNSADGEIRASITNSENQALCLDANFAQSESKIRLAPCIKDDSKRTGEQKFLLTWHEDLRLKSRGECLDVPQNSENAPVILYSCHAQKGNQFWKYLLNKMQIYHVVTQKCLTADGPTQSVFVAPCSSSNTQKWEMENVKEDVIRRYNLNM